MADNWQLDITNEGTEKLRLAMKLAMSWHSKATHYCVHHKLGLVLLWHEDANVDGVAVQKLPFPLKTSDMLADFVAGWLSSADYPEKPDFDGSSVKGWRVYNEEWGHVGKSHYAFVAIQPVWSLYGK